MFLALPPVCLRKNSPGLRIFENQGLMRKSIIIFLATATYTGYFPAMPGTVGTLWGVIIAFFAAFFNFSPYLQALTIVAVFLASVFLAGEAAKIFGGKDPKSIVCDEVCGFLVSIFLVPFTFFNVILVFILFRIFDILKPCPIGLIDRKVKGGLGIVLDDVAAGVYANIGAHIIIWFRH